MPLRSMSSRSATIGGQRQPNRDLAQHVFAVAQSGDRLLRVNSARGGDDHRVDIRSREDGLETLETVVKGRRLEIVAADPA